VNETRSSHVATTVRNVQRRVLLPTFLLASSSVLLLSGCSSGLNFAGRGTAESASVSELHGSVHGGQWPVVNSIVSLYEIGTSGYAAALGAPLGTATTCNYSGANCTVGSTTLLPGQWDIPSPTACANANDELYLVAYGGEGGEDPGSQNTTNNTALVLTSVAGPCSAQFTTQFNIDEVTTVATEYALAGFSSDYQHVGTSSTNLVGLTNAFATVTNLVNLTTGTANQIAPANVSYPYVGGSVSTYPAPGSNPASQPPDLFSSIVPQDTIYTLANVLGSCVNDSGGATGSFCSPLFSYTGGSNAPPLGQYGVQGPAAATCVAAPSSGLTCPNPDTADAALYIAHNPGLPSAGGPANGSNVAAVFGLPTPEAPFNPALTGAPNDFTLTLNFVSGGLGGTSATNIATGKQVVIDMNGGVWIVESHSKVLTSLSNLGAPLSPTSTTTAAGGYPITSVNEAASPILTNARLDTDQQGNVWISDLENCVWAFSPSGSQLSGSPFTGDCPSGGESHTVTVDASDNVWVGGLYFITSITNPAGVVRSGFPDTTQFDSLSEFLQPDEATNVWFTDAGNFSGGYVNQSGAVSEPYAGDYGNGTANYSDFGIMGNGLALWVPIPAQESIIPEEAVSPLAPGAYATVNPPTGYAMYEIQSDGNNRFFFDNDGSTTQGISANIAEYTAGETQVSGSGAGGNGFEGGSAYVSMDEPEGMAIDQSGNAWMLNTNNYQAANKTGPYASDYAFTGGSCTNVTEYVGLAGPRQPVNSFNAKNSTYGVKP
jgi:hypothetical protein